MLTDLYAALPEKDKDGPDPPQDRLCIEALRLMRLLRQVQDKNGPFEVPERDRLKMNFLRYFSQLQDKGICPPTLDQFTKAMIATNGSAP